jgi:hypothetical protein
VLGLLGLAGVIVMLIAMADVPRQSYYLLIAAFGLLIVALAGALAVLLATNTRRPWGIDPNLGSHYSMHRTEEVDPYTSSTEELLRHAVQLPDGNGYGRRQSDDVTVVRRLASAVAHDDQPLPPKLISRGTTRGSTQGACAAVHRDTARRAGSGACHAQRPRPEEPAR